jgi:hypothetical protein
VRKNTTKCIGCEEHNLPQVLTKREQRRAQRVKEANNHWREKSKTSDW